MTTFSFIIPANTGIVSSDTTVIVDKGSSIKGKPKIRLASFGDGFEQRLPDGVNHISKTFNIRFSPRTKEEIDDIIDFFEYMGGVTSFEVTLPNSNRTETERIVIDDWDKNYSHDNFYSATASGRKVNEA